MNAALAQAFASVRVHEETCLLCKFYPHLCEIGRSLRRSMTNVQLPRSDRKELPMPFAPMPIANANHVHVATRVVVSGYTAPLADPPNPAAHGGICVREWCGCGAERATNRNNGQRETSGWSWKGGQV